MLSKWLCLLRAREVGMTLTCEAISWRGFQNLQEHFGGSSYITGPHFPGLTMAANKGRRKQTTGRCDPLWEELEMGLQTRPRHSSHALSLSLSQPCESSGPCGKKSRRAMGGRRPSFRLSRQCGWGRRSLAWPHGLKGCRRSPTGMPGGSAMQFWIKNRNLAELRTSISFPEIRYPGVAWFSKGRQDCVCGCFKGALGFNGDIPPLFWTGRTFE